MAEQEKRPEEKPWSELTPREQVFRYYGVPYREPSEETLRLVKETQRLWAERQRKAKQSGESET